MLLYKDQDFQEKWTTVPSLGLDDNIYVKVFMVSHVFIFSHLPIYTLRWVVENTL